ncbi:pantoate--beta-alanine ligase [Nocardioides bigeumensis]|uniref:Pantothenate synthetase n=1 Tax=Nocardioides bigeumensis TaxID=433657 RepID=A0ABP5KKH9_9ACTN
MATPPSDGPVVTTTRAELDAVLAPARAAGRRVGFVATMGALHAGHASLMARVRQLVDDGPVVVSIFVNPTQFGAGEDLDRYPRTLDDDLAMCAREGVDVVFAPSVEEVYPRGVSTGSATVDAVTVEPGSLAERYEGASRPGHFRGVLTVVAKLFGLVRPDVTVFGQKDYQQLVLVRRMSADLCLRVEVLGGDTVREPDGLALSSRNRYLSPTERTQALALSRALRAAQTAAVDGPAAALAAVLGVLDDADGVEVDYVAVTDRDLGDLPVHVPPGTEGRALVAARVGTTRLIDNVPLAFGATRDH